MQLCDAHGLPIVSLVDTPGFMVGPEIETRGQVRHVSRMFVVAAQLRVPFFAVVLRKAYGLGAMAMAAGGLHAPVPPPSWPSGEFGAMGLEGAVELGFRKELDAAPARRRARGLFASNWWRRNTPRARRSTWPPRWRSTPSSTRPRRARWLAATLASARPAQPGGRFIDPW